jgi:hypothetical protein
VYRTACLRRGLRESPTNVYKHTAVLHSQGYAAPNALVAQFPVVRPSISSDIDCLHIFHFVYIMKINVLDSKADIAIRSAVFFVVVMPIR